MVVEPMGALASFDAQVAPINAVGGGNPPLTVTATGSIGGVITPIDYLVGKLITDNFGTSPNVNSQFLVVQPIIFTCPTTALFAGAAGVPYCGLPSGPAGSGGQVAETAVLGVLSGSPAPPLQRGAAR